MPVYDFDPPQRFVAGTVGPPGQRVFFLQARDSRRLVSASCEKEQLTVLADRLLDLLDERGGAAGSDAAAAAYADDLPLDTPIEDEFRVNTLSLAWDPAGPSVVIEASHEDSEATGTETGDDSDDSDDSGDEAGDQAGPTLTDTLRVSMGPGQARAFALRAKALISAGRPPCPFCAGPLDPAGHVCPRSNGYRR